MNTQIRRKNNNSIWNGWWCSIISCFKCKCKHSSLKCLALKNLLTIYGNICFLNLIIICKCNTKCSLLCTIYCGFKLATCCISYINLYSVNSWIINNALICVVIFSCCTIWSNFFYCVCMLTNCILALSWCKRILNSFKCNRTCSCHTLSIKLCLTFLKNKCKFPTWRHLCTWSKCFCCTKNYSTTSIINVRELYWWINHCFISCYI